MENEVEARKNQEDLHIYLEIGGINDSQVELETGENWITIEEYRENVQEIIETAEKQRKK